MKLVQVDDSSHNKGMYCLSSKPVNRYQGDDFSCIGTRMDAIKLVMVNWYI